MCGRYALHSALARVAAEFGVTESTDLADDAPGYNIAPGRDLPVCVAAYDGRRSLRTMRWGLVPTWARDPSIGQRLINARAETIASKPAFRAAYRRRRCVVPADGFYEWQKTAAGKQPWYIRRADLRLLAMAGLWEQRERDGEPPLLSFTIVTTEANDALRHIHQRMPVLLDDDAMTRWLARDTGGDKLGALLRPWPADETLAQPVSRAVNNARHDAPDCVQPI